MKSIDVVTAVLDHMISHIKTKSGLQSLSFESKYVLTLPTGACKDSMAFMREAAVKVSRMFWVICFSQMEIVGKILIF